MSSGRVFAVLACACLTAAAARAGGVEAPGSASPSAADLGGARAALPLIIGRYEADAGSLRRAWPPGPSPARADRFRRFQREWLAALEGLDYDALDRPGKVDYLLLRNHIGHELAQIDRQDAQATETAPLLPFASTVHELEEARHRFEPVDPAAAATLLTALDRRIKDARKAAAGGGDSPKAEAKDGKAAPAKAEGGGGAGDPHRPGPTKAVAARAGRQAAQLRTMLASWFHFSEDYDPLFTWWVAEPYKAVDRSLGDYATYLRETLGGVKSGDDAEITGEPIGREALTAELAWALVPYSPEELASPWPSASSRGARREMRKASRDDGPVATTGSRRSRS